MSVAIRPDRDGASGPAPDIPSAVISNTADAGDRSHWQTPLFTCTDGYTNCMALFCPFVLCSKTAWRLDRVERGQDPLDSSWECIKGINLLCVGNALLQGMTGFSFPASLWYQRHRIRETYNIRGNPVGDFLLSFLCICCVNTQNDREVRVREGDMRLRKALKLDEISTPDIATVQILPPRIEPMRYVSPRQTSEHTSNVSFAPPDYTPDLQILQEVQNASPPRSRLAFLRPHKKRKDAVASPQQESTANASIQDADGPLAVDQERTSEVQHAQGANEEMEHSVGRLDLPTSSNTATEAQQDNLGPENPDSAAERVRVEDETTGAPDRESTEGSLTESEARDIATSLRGKRSNIGAAGGPQLSYVHDFSDEWPVNKSVLMYYEKEENKSKTPTPQVDVNSKLSSNNPYQRLLSSSDQAWPSTTGRDTATYEHTGRSYRAASSSRPTGGTMTASSFYEGSGFDLDGSSSKPPKTRSAEEFGQLPPSYEADRRSEKKATSF